MSPIPCLFSHVRKAHSILGFGFRAFGVNQICVPHVPAQQVFAMALAKLVCCLGGGNKHRHSNGFMNIAHDHLAGAIFPVSFLKLFCCGLAILDFVVEPMHMQFGITRKLSCKWLCSFVS